MNKDDGVLKVFQTIQRAAPMIGLSIDELWVELTRVYVADVVRAKTALITMSKASEPKYSTTNSCKEEADEPSLADGYVCVHDFLKMKGDVPNRSTCVSVGRPSAAFCNLRSLTILYFRRKSASGHRLSRPTSYYPISVLEEVYKKRLGLAHSPAVEVIPQPQLQAEAMSVGDDDDMDEILQDVGSCQSTGDFAQIDEFFNT